MSTSLGQGVVRDGNAQARLAVDRGFQHEVAQAGRRIGDCLQRNFFDGRCLDFRFRRFPGDRRLRRRDRGRLRRDRDARGGRTLPGPGPDGQRGEMREQQRGGRPGKGFQKIGPASARSVVGKKGGRFLALRPRDGVGLGREQDHGFEPVHGPQVFVEQTRAVKRGRTAVVDPERQRPQDRNAHSDRPCQEQMFPRGHPQERRMHYPDQREHQQQPAIETKDRCPALPPARTLPEQVGRRGGPGRLGGGRTGW